LPPPPSPPSPLAPPPRPPPLTPGGSYAPIVGLNLTLGVDAATFDAAAQEQLHGRLAAFVGHGVSAAAGHVSTLSVEPGSARTVHEIRCTNLTMARLVRTLIDAASPVVLTAALGVPVIDSAGAKLTVRAVRGPSPPPPPTPPPPMPPYPPFAPYTPPQQLAAIGILALAALLLLLALCYYLRMRRLAYRRRRAWPAGSPSKVSPLKRPKYSAAARSAGGGLYPDWYKGPRSGGKWEGGVA
jgi:hypothetical protein